MRLVVFVPAVAVAVVLLLMLTAHRRRRIAAREFAEADRLSAARAITSSRRPFAAEREAEE